ncbi:MAG: carbamoyl transferase [Deltaproteobacteria bacterium]|nr:carbamoyl transferase [Deltaproteobacteria bacterium]
MSTTILGVNSAYHESSACLLRDGEVIAAVEEERFNRVKHGKHSRVDNAHELPNQAIECVLQMGGVAADAVDHVGYTLDPELRRDRNCDLGEPGIAAGDFGTAEGEEAFYRSNQQALAALRERFPRAEVHPLRHHLCHAASAFFPSRHERAAVLTVDGIGEFATTFLGVGNGNRIDPIAEVNYPNSLGFVWEKISEHLGFDVYSGPGKVMGYACITDPIGERSEVDYAARFRQLVRPDDHGFTVDNGIMRFRTGDFDWLASLFGPRRRSVIDRYEDASIAAGLQIVTEEVFVHLARLLHNATRSEALCVAGGVALNCVANTQILEQTKFGYLHVEPAANDAGTAIGAACLIWNQVLGNQQRPRLDHTYLGPEYGEDELATALSQAGLKATRPDDIARDCARLIHDGKIVAWFQGRLEFGPRALGNRSILADPSRFDMRTRLNSKVKERESFRPFAPSVLAEDLPRFLREPRDCDAAEYMLLALPVRDRRSAQHMPAVVQENGSTGLATSRVHSVRDEVNPLYARLLRELRQLSGIGMVLNTSFNISEPIVCTPQQAVATFVRSRMDALAMGPFLVKR